MRRRLGIVLMLVAGAWLRPDGLHALDSVCARVKIEIKQELTLERQAFDAHMRITNGLSHISLENVRVTVSFADADGTITVLDARKVVLMCTCVNCMCP